MQTYICLPKLAERLYCLIIKFCCLNLLSGSPLFMTSESFSTQDPSLANASCRKAGAHLCSKDEIVSAVYDNNYKNRKWGMYNEKGGVARALTCNYYYKKRCYPHSAFFGLIPIDCVIATLQMNTIKHAYCCK